MTDGKALSGKIVVDLLFEANSANYDQGIGNLQELKKVVMPNGNVHTLISRYALRYSILETMRNFYPGESVKADGKHFSKEGSGNKQVVQIKPDSLLTGEIFQYPEFVLFGFLVAVKKNKNEKGIQIPRENPTKISHAISLTPFAGDVLMYANHDWAKRARADPNPFNKEEHYALYSMNIILDIDKMKEFGFYANQSPKNFHYLEIDNKWEKTLMNGKVKISAKKDDVTNNYHYTVSISDEYLREILKAFLKALLHLERNHQGQQKIWVKLMRVQWYKDGKADTIIDKITLEPTMKEIVEITEKTEEIEGKKITVKEMVRRMVKELGLCIPGYPGDDKIMVGDSWVDNFIENGFPNPVWAEPSQGASRSTIGSIKMAIKELKECSKAP